MRCGVLYMLTLYDMNTAADLVSPFVYKLGRKKIIAFLTLIELADKMECDRFEHTLPRLEQFNEFENTKYNIIYFSSIF